jgi:putative hydrolase of HD superfamily
MKSIIDFLKVVYRLKSIPRTGWIVRGISPSQTETVASHIFTTSLLTMLFIDLLEKEGCKINFEKALRIAILHDITEALTFDINKNFLKKMKINGRPLKEYIEKEALKRIFKKCPARISLKYQHLLDDLNKEKSIEAKIVKAADRFDILIQILIYEEIGFSRKAFNELWRKVEREVSTYKIGFFADILKDIKSLREGGEAYKPRTNNG